MRLSFAKHLAPLFTPVDAASAAVFRILFGLIMFGGTVRFVASGWIEKLYVTPTYFFKYAGFEWVIVWPKTGLYLHFGLIAVLALMIAAGVFYRISAALFCLAFAYVQLMDVTNYLNHYYLVVLLSGLMVFLPLNRIWSIDSWRKTRRMSPVNRPREISSWVIYLLRAQVAIVYINAAFAKVGPDWLLHAQPMSIWLSARNEIPLIGSLLDDYWVAYAFSWSGFLYDLSIVFLLSWRRSRPFAYVTVLVFHFLTHVLFDIGMFPIIMPIVTTIFFAPSWPRRLFSARKRSPTKSTDCTETPERSSAPSMQHVIGIGALSVYLVLQVCLPLRSHFYEGDVLWHEEGMRYSWKVMVREKNGSITYRVKQLDGPRTWEVSPFDYLQWRQVNEMSGQPDLIMQLGKHIAHDFEQRGRGPVAVYVDAFASLNGRKAQRLIDPNVDINRVSYNWRQSDWITRQASGSPLRPKAVIK